MKKITLIFLTLYIFSTLDTISQTDWKWGYQGINNTNCYVEIGCIDNLNNTYSIYPYDSVLYLKDTIISHEGFFYMWPNYAIVKIDPNGNFVNALDLHTSQDGALWNEYMMVVDDELNLYVMIQFKDSIYVNDSAFSTKSSSTDLILLKLNSQFELLWSKYISSPHQDWCHGIALTENNDIFIYTEHYGNGLINFLNQDTAYHGSPMLSFMKINENGSLIWRKELISTNPGMFGGSSSLGEDGNFYGVGASGDTLFLDGDTIYTPITTINDYHIFDIAFRPNGSLKRMTFPNSQITFPTKLVDSEGNYYFSALINDTVIFGNDTLNCSIGNYTSLIGKMDSLYNPIWYQKLNFTVNTGYSFSFKIDKKSDTLYFAVNCLGSFEFMDSIYNTGNTESILYGQFSFDGELISTNIASGSSKLVARNIKVDNCYNYYISGYFKGELIIGDDTLIQNNLYPETVDGLIARISNVSNPSIDLGSDTIISISETIGFSIPENFNDIFWSTGDTTYAIVVSGEELGEGLHKIWVDAFQGNCIAITDTVKVLVIDDSGISENNNYMVIFYPNPTEYTLNIYSENGKSLDQVSIYNLLGESVFYKKNVNNSMDLSKLRNGVYIIETNINNMKMRQKLIIKK